MVVSVAAPPHNLQLILDYVNTHDLEQATDALASAPELHAWLCQRGLLSAGVPGLDAEQLSRALALRDALRATLQSNAGGGPATRPASAELERVAEHGRLSISFATDGSLAVRPRAAGFAGALAGLLVPIAHATADGTWTRAKACHADNCQWAFYDRSRNRSGRWCEMAVCGNRRKVGTYRSRHAGHD